MNRDELIMKYFDKELNQQELEQFNMLLNTDKSFKEEVRSLAEVENALKSFAPAITLDDEGFLTNVGNKVTGHKQPVSHSGGLAASANSIKMFMTSAIVITGIAVLSFVGYNQYFSKNEENTNQIKVEKQIEQNSNEILIEDTKANDAVKLHTEKPIVKSIKSDEEKINSDEQAKPDEIVQPLKHPQRIDGEMQGTIMDNNPVKNNEIIANLRNELQGFHNSGDVLNEVWTLKRLGVFYGQLNNYTQSNKYLNQALSLSSKLQVATLQAEIYGELAYINFKQGMKTKADEYKNKCLLILNANSSKRAKYWLRKFRKF